VGPGPECFSKTKKHHSHGYYAKSVSQKKENKGYYIKYETDHEFVSFSIVVGYYARGNFKYILEGLSKGIQQSNVKKTQILTQQIYEQIGLEKFKVFKEPVKTKFPYETVLFNIKVILIHLPPQRDFLFHLQTLKKSFLLQCLVHPQPFFSLFFEVHKPFLLSFLL